MNATALNVKDIPPRGEPTPPFCWVGNEVLDVWLPIMGADCLTLYTLFARRVYFDPKLKHNIRELAVATEIGFATVSRCLEIIEYLGLVKLTRFGGSKDSECELRNSLLVANRLGATYDSGTHSYSLPPQVAQRLISEVKAIREKQQGKKPQSTPRGAPRSCGNRLFSDSQRNSSVSPERRQRATRETQTGSHLIREEGRNEEVPSPTPSHTSEEQATKDSPDKNEPDPLLKWARAAFTGPMNDLGDHLLDTSKPPVRHLANGADEWKRFDSLAVYAAARRGGALVLTLSARNPVAAHEGLKRYHSTWEPSLRKWYGCEVLWEVQETK